MAYDYKAVADHKSVQTQPYRSQMPSPQAAAVGAELPVGARSRTVGSCRHSGHSR